MSFLHIHKKIKKFFLLLVSNTIYLFCVLRANGEGINNLCMDLFYKFQEKEVENENMYIKIY